MTIILTHNERPQEVIMAKNWILAFAMRQAPADLRWWPKNLKYMFDHNNLQVSQTIVFSIYDIFVSRTVQITVEKSKKQYTLGWKNVIRTAILDKDYKLRHSWTQNYTVVWQLNAEIYWFFTATPVVKNSLVSDISLYWYGETLILLSKISLACFECYG